MIIERNLYQKIRPYLESKEAIIITGMRRVGKTTLLKWIFDQIPSNNKLNLDLENPINQKYFEQEDYGRIRFILETLNLNFKERAYIFLDEIQLVRNVPQVVKYFIDHHQVKFFLTGSASYYLKNLFAESLSGRKYIFELYPLTFQEFLLLKGEKIQLPQNHQDVSKPIFDTLNKFYLEYLEFGGFPQVVVKETMEEKRRSLQDIFSSYFQLEVERLGDFKKVHKLRDLILLLAGRVGTKLDVTKLTQELSISRQTVNDYISFLEGTYFIKLIKPFSRNRDVEIRKMPKIYLCDSGLMNVISRVPEGMAFEQNVFQNIMTRGQVNYYQRKNGAEIDFILDKEHAYEVKMTAFPSDIQKLERLSRELELPSHHLVALNYSDLEKVIFGMETGG